MENSLTSSHLKASIVLPGWNEKKNILNCICSLKKQTYHEFNVYMILGGDDTVFIEKAFNYSWDQLIVLDQVEPNKMKAYNLALQHPDLGDILIFSDVDCEFPENFVGQYIESFKDPQKNVVTGKVHPFQRNNNFIERYQRNWGDKHTAKLPRIIKSIVGANYAIRKDFFFSKFHQFDESVLIGTDHFIAKRLMKIGESIYFNPHLIVYTEFYASDLSKYIAQRARWVRIRILKNRRSNQKVFRSSIYAILVAWFMLILFPMGIFVSRILCAGPFWWLWYIPLFAWITIWIISWEKEFKILRYKQDNNEGRVNIFQDLFGSFGLVTVHLLIRMFASLQLLFKKYRD